MEKLPREVLLEIFIHLSAKQLAQMRCICKSWNGLLSDSSFVKSHLHHSLHNNDGILLFFHDGLDFDCSTFKAGPTCSLDRELTNFIKLPVNTQSKHGCGWIIGSVNGLICFYYRASVSCPREYVVCIWNPSLSAVLTLPPCSLSYSDSVLLHFWFGYDPKSDDYKVVKVASLLEPFNILPEVEVYSMRKGSWELITQSFPSNITMIPKCDNVCVDGHDGHLHWLCYTELDSPRQTIVGFDLGAETFSEMPLPDSLLHHPESRWNVLGILGGKLCVMSRILDRDQCEVWVMGEHDSWVKHNVFSQLISGIKAPYGFTSHGEFLFRDYDRFSLYDPITSHTKTFKIRGEQFGISKIVEYVDSLVWVAPAKHELSKGHLLHFFWKSNQLLKGLQKTIKGIF